MLEGYIEKELKNHLSYCFKGGNIKFLKKGDVKVLDISNIPSYIKIPRVTIGECEQLAKDTSKEQMLDEVAIKILRAI